MKQIVLFSGGASSAYTAKLVIDKYGKENTILLHTPTYAEDEDTERFRQEVAKYLGLPITIQEDGRDLWTLIEDSNCLPSMFIPLAKYYPEQFEKAVQMEKKIGHTVFKDCTLEELREEVMQSKNQITFLDNDFNIPCECWD